jgi:AraC-like DNA-binding protein
VGGDERPGRININLHGAPPITRVIEVSVAREAGAVLYECDIYREWAPPLAWRAAVACCWEQRVGVDRVHRVVPDGRADMLLFEDGRIQVVGLHDIVSLSTLPAGTRLRGIRFRPAAVAVAFGVPGVSLHNQTLDAGDVLGVRIARSLTDPARLDGWVRSIEPDRRARAAVDLLRTRSVALTADALGIDRRHLTRVMLQQVGVAPKTFQRVQRFQRFVQAVDAGSALAAAAADAGYADQSHLSREVRAFSLLTPARLAAERRAS